MFLLIAMSPGDNRTIRRAIWTLRLENPLVRFILPIDIQRQDKRSRAPQLVQLQNQVNAFCVLVASGTLSIVVAFETLNQPFSLQVSIVPKCD